MKDATPTSNRAAIALLTVVILVFALAGTVWMTPAPADDMFPYATDEQMRNATATPWRPSE